MTLLDSSSDTLRAQVTEYLRRSGMSPEDFARRVGYSYSTLAQFMCGRYSRIARADRICTSIRTFLADYPIEPALFAKKIYETGAVRALRTAFQALLEEPQIYMLYAPPGSGKTDVARYLIAEYNAHTAPNQKSYIFRVNCREGICPRDLMKRVATACGSYSDTGIDRAINNLRWDFRGARVVLYFDEAQHLSIRCLETVRELLDEEPYFSLFFAGAEELESTFTRFATELERFNRRIIDTVKLPALTAEEASGILRSELAEFSPGPALIRQQIELATTTVRVDKKHQRYISIGRLMAAVKQIRKNSLPAVAQKAEAVA
ncbi:MAG: ATP-binding protein [Terracidiphilus sp.]|nr:ATP-binding protein [Terracidiphilus sp.]